MCKYKYIHRYNDYNFVRKMHISSTKDSRVTLEIKEFKGSNEIKCLKTSLNVLFNTAAKTILKIWSLVK